MNALSLAITNVKLAAQCAYLRRQRLRAQERAEFAENTLEVIRNRLHMPHLNTCDRYALLTVLEAALEEEAKVKAVAQ